MVPMKSSHFKPFAGLAAPVPCKHPTVRSKDLALDQVKLCCQGHQAFACGWWDAIIFTLGDKLQQLLNAISPDTGDNAKLGQVGTDRIDQRRSLAHKQLPSAM